MGSQMAPVPRRRGAGGRAGVRALPLQKNSCRTLLGHGKAGRNQDLLLGIPFALHRGSCTGVAAHSQGLDPTCILSPAYYHPASLWGLVSSELWYLHEVLLLSPLR